MNRLYRKIELKVYPSSNKQISRLDKFFRSAAALCRHVVKSSITDFDKVKQYENSVLGAPVIRGIVQELSSLSNPRCKDDYVSIHYIDQVFRVVSKSKIEIQKLGSFRVCGLKQLDKFPEYEIATVKLIKRDENFYIHLIIKKGDA